MTGPYIAGFHEPAGQNPREFGGKAAGLAGLTAAGLPVAPGFAVGAAAYRAFLDESGLRAVVREALATAPDNWRGRVAAADHIARHLAVAPVPLAVATAIRDRYHQLCAAAGVSDVAVAVRSSATAEDSAATSFAGEFDTWVDITGAAAVLAHVHRCWSSIFSARAITYAHTNDLDPADLEMAVVIQRMVRAQAAGVMFTLSPVTGDRSRIVIEASWGLGISVVGGEVTPDRWVVDKITLSIVDHTPGDKRIQYLQGPDPVPVDPTHWTHPCLTNDQVFALARLGKQIERTNGCPQDIEFALEADTPVLLQSRPETVWSTRPTPPRFDPTDGLTQWITGAVTPHEDAA